MKVPILQHTIKQSAKVALFGFLAIAGSLVSCSGDDEKSGDGRSFIIVLDTSGSMAEGKNSTMAQVKRSIPRLMEAIRVGDSVSLMTFDNEARLVDTIEIDSPGDKKAVQERLNTLEPIGRYTDMGAMLVALQEVAARVQKEKQDQFLIVLSDGVDDPPPERKRKDRVDLEKYRSERGGPVQERYIYYVSLGKTEDPALKEGLGNMGSRLKVVKGEEPPGSAEGEAKGPKATGPKATEQTGEGNAAGQDGGSSGTSTGAVTGDGQDPTGLGAVARDIQEVSKPWYQKWWEENAVQFAIYGGGILLALLVLILLFLLIRAMLKGPKPHGKIFYYQEGRSGAKNEFNLAKLKTDQFSIGSSTGVNLKIKDLGAPGKVTLKTKKSRGEISLKPQGKSSRLINFVDREGKPVINKGDRFKIGNYIFEYGNAQEK